MFYAGTDLGIAYHLTRVVARDRSATSGLMNLFISFRLLLIPAGISVAIVVGLVRHESLAAFIGVAIAQGLVTIQALYEALFLACERQATVAALTIVSSVSIVAGCGLWIVFGRSLVELALSYASAMVIATTIWMLRAGTDSGSGPA